MTDRLDGARFSRKMAQLAPTRAHIQVILLAISSLAGCREAWNHVGDVRGPSAPAACEASYRNELHLAAVGDGDRSHWLQPWRGHSATRPALALRRALGFGIFPQAPWIAMVPRFAQAGCARVAVETHWAMLEYEGPARFKADEETRLRATLQILADNRLRPKLLLDSTRGRPCPLRELALTVAVRGLRGDRHLELDRAAAEAARPGRTLVMPAGPDGDHVLLTGIDPDGRASLSRALADDVPAGPIEALLLRHEPFGADRLPDGEPDPAYLASLSGWLDYSRLVAELARATLGDGNFDIEITRTERPYFDARAYRDEGALAHDDWRASTQKLIEHTAAHLRTGIVGPGVKLGDGLGNVDHFVAAGNLAAGTNALVRRGGVAGLAFGPATAAAEGRPLDAFAAVMGQMVSTAPVLWQDDFVPSYQVLMPELPLTGILPRSLARDLAPVMTLDSRGIAHGRTATGPEVWISGVALDPGPAERDPPLTEGERWRMQTKATLRAAAAYVGSGADAVFFHGPPDSRTALFDLASPTGGPVLEALARLRGAVDGPDVVPPRSLLILGVSSCDGHRQFDGDGSAAHPPLLDRDVVAAFPFQSHDDRFVVLTYVMTRDLGRTHGASGRDPPAQPYELRLRGLRAGRVSASAVDLSTGSSVPVQVSPRGDGDVIVQVMLDDAPRALVIEDGGV